MLNDLPTDYSVAVNTPDPVTVKVVPSDGLLFILGCSLIICAAWVKNQIN